MRKNRISSFHYLTQDDLPKNHAEQALAAVRAGVRWVQLRTKNKEEEEWENMAREVKTVTDRYNAVLIINDNPHLAKKIKADGVHLGRLDMPVTEARKLLGANFIIGATANNEEELKEVVNQRPDYIGLGPYRFTATKQKLSPVLENNVLKKLILSQKDIPIVVIGGITLQDIEPIFLMGAHGIAVSSAVNKAPDPGQTASEFCNRIKKHLYETVDYSRNIV